MQLLLALLFLAMVIWVACSKLLGAMGSSVPPEGSEVWRASARKGGLGRITGESTVTGWSGPLRLQIDTTGGDIPATRLQADCPAGFWAPVSLRRRSETDGIRYLFASPEVETGDARFDAVFRVSADSEGPSETVAAVFDSTLRRALIGLLLDDATVALDHGRLLVQIPPTGQVDAVAAVVRHMVAAAGRLAVRLDVPHALARNAREDHDPAVRLNCLRQLRGAFADDALTETTVRAALQDRAATVRVAAALALGPEGVPTLRQVAESSDEDADDLSRARAVGALGAVLPVADTGAILERAIRARWPETARACLDVLGRSGSADAVPLVTRVMVTDSGDLAPVAARALMSLPAASAEPQILAALECEVPGLRVAAAEALGRVGTVAAVPALERTAEEHPGAGDLPEVARAAVARIHSRLVGAAPGQLSLSVPESGDLSLAGDDGGELSLAGERGIRQPPPSRAARVRSRRDG
jgi:hypothetical protein